MVRETKIENLMDNNLNDFFFKIQTIFILGVITLLFFEIWENDTLPKPEGKNNSFSWNLKKLIIPHFVYISNEIF